MTPNKDMRYILISLSTVEPFVSKIDAVFAQLTRFIHMLSRTHPDVLAAQKLFCIPSVPSFDWQMYSEEIWKEFEIFVKQDPYAFGLSDWDSVHKGRVWQLTDVKIDIDVCAKEGQYRHLYRFGFGITIKLRKEIFQSLLPYGLLDLIDNLAVIINAFAGFIDYTAHLNHPLNSEMIDIANFSIEDISHHFNDTAIGYFWRTLLTTGLIDKLGGMEYIKEHNPCAVLKLTSINDSEAVWIQATGDVLDMTAGARKKLRAFLEPVLPKPSIFKLADEIYYNRKCDLIVLTPDEKSQIKELKRLTHGELVRKTSQEVVRDR